MEKVNQIHTHHDPGIQCAILLFWVGAANIFLDCTLHICNLTYLTNGTSQAIRSTYHTTLHATPSQLVLYMIQNIAFRANWDQIQRRKQDIINKSNKTRTSVDFLMNIRLETISCNECVEKWYNQNPRRNCVGKSEYP
jgi:hypothetical protein